MSKLDEAKAEIVAQEVLSDGWTQLSNFTLDYTGSDGHTNRLHREIYHRGEAACVLMRDPSNDKVVLVRQFRLPLRLNGDPDFGIEVPAGLTDGEEPEAAIRREAIEETGYALSNLRHLFRAYSSPGCITEVLHFFAADVDLTKVPEGGGGLAEEHEDIEVMTVTLDEGLAMVGRGEIVDMKTILLLQWAALQRMAG